MKYFLSLALITFMLVSCKQENTPQQKKIAFDGIDLSIKPGDDFFNHVNKSWYENAVIADDQVGVGYYRFLNIPQKKLLQNILEEVSGSDHKEGSIEQKLGDFYASGMDTVSIDKRGFEPIQPVLDSIDGIKNMTEMMAFIADGIKSGNYSVIYPNISPDQKNSSMNIAHFYQTGLGLPDRDYYFRTDSSTVDIQKSYLNYMTTLFELTGQEDASEGAEIVYNIDKQLAEAHKTRVERRDAKLNYHKLSVTEIDGRQKNIGWPELLRNLGIQADSIDVKQLVYYDRLNTMLETVPLDEWKIYLKANSMTAFADYLSKPFQIASFNYSKELSGQSVRKSRSQQIVRIVDKKIGFALGQLYVKRYFNENAKDRALELVNNLQKAFESRINHLDWMSDSTKVKAIEKLYAITKKIGYPDVWRTYDVPLVKDNYFENIIVLNQNDYRYELEQLNEVPNAEEWGTTPSTVTAYYNRSLNEIVFPAGILQYPYFDANADDALNYGAIGMVIGHELTHAFDDQGARFDKEGNFNNWWTEEDFKKFKTRTQQVIDRYETFTVLDSLHLKGALTVGENTADLGGVSIAYDAFKMTEQGKDTIRIEGYSPDQRFFLSIARMWRVKMRDEYLRSYIKNDPHSPPIWRVNGPLMSFTPFYEAFNVMPGDQNYKPESERIKIW